MGQDDRHVAGKTGLEFFSHGTPADRRKPKTPFSNTAPLRGGGKTAKKGAAYAAP
jgi:hypothetical protein